MSESSAVEETDEVDEVVPQSSGNMGASSADPELGDSQETTTSSVPVLKEFEPLNHMLNMIPSKAQRGLKVYPIDLTCLDASKSFIALGSNLGILFLYNREKQSLQRLTCDSKSEVMSCVKMQEGLEFQIALGTHSGLLCVFILPSILPGRNKQLLKFTIPGLHKSRVTCLEWSTNGMKLYSGDEQGNIVCTKVDIEKGQCASDIILKESHKIVQLDYAHKTLLVSSRMRTILCHTENNNSVSQVGQKDRKCLGNFGACFVAGLGQKDSYLYAARPGLRLWKAGLDGEVKATFILKDILNNSSCPSIELLDTLSPIKTVVSPSDRQFGPVVVYDKKHIMTWNESSMYVLDPEVNTVVAVSNRVGVLKSIVTCDDEIFVLRMGSDRNVIRIAQKPEEMNIPKEHTRLSVLDFYKEDTMLSQLEFTPPPSPVYGASLAANATERKKSSPSPLHMLFGKIKHKEEKPTTVEDVRSKRKSPFGFNKSGAGTIQVTDNADVKFKPLTLSDNLGASDSLKTNLMAPQAVKRPIPEVGVDVREIVSSTSELPPVVKLDSSEVLKIDLTAEMGSDFSTMKSESLGSKMGTGNSVFKATKDKAPTQQTPLDRYSKIGGEKFDDIVFQPKMKKKPKKKTQKASKDNQDLNSLSADSSSSASVSKDKGSQQAPQVVQDHQPPPDPNLLQDIKNIVRPEMMAKAVKPDITSDLHGSRSEAGGITSNTDKLSPEFKPTLKGEKQPENPPTKLKDKGEASDNQDHTNKATFTSSLIPDVAVMSGGELACHKLNDLVLEKQNLQRSDQSAPKDEKRETKLEGSSAYSSKTTETLEFNREIKTEFHITQPSQNKSETSTKGSLEDTNTPFKPKAAQVTSPETPSEDIYSSFLMETEGGRGPPIYKTSDASMDDLYKGYAEDSPEKEASCQASGLQVGASAAAKPPESSLSSQESFEGQMLDMVWSNVSESWTECTLQGNLQDLTVSSKHVWYVDRSDRIFWAPINEHGLPWKQLDVKANQLAVSPNGLIVWRLFNGVVFAGTKISTKNPGGQKWVEALRDVTRISVDDTSAWYIKNSGDVMMQKSLTKDRPCFKSFSVTPNMKLIDIQCYKGVVWAIDENHHLVVRTGIKPNASTGSGWKLVESALSLSVTSISLADQDRGWLMDTSGKIWFCSGVSPQKPEGEGTWWQVMFSEYLVQDPTAMDTFKNIAEVLDPQNLSKVTSAILGHQGGCVAAGEMGLFVGPENKAALQVCRGNIIGHDWFQANPIGMASSTRWSLVSATVANGPAGLVWASQPNGELFCFTLDSRQFSCVSVPMGCLFTCLSTTTDAVWGLTAGGTVYIRSGIGPHCPQGASWVQLDLDQLGDSKLVSVSCGTENVWAVDDKGAVFLRIGTKAPSSHYLNPAWVQVDGLATAGAIFTQVATGPEDWMVWAIDNKKCVYVRAAVTYEMPIGTHWIPVAGKLCKIS
ncbi:tectonin beta-propeller repeat-containing protein 2-like isoform X1 [Lingula anatina]|uniref:Tectonin beta-propeller repeat-containing protein 2-like isoform X1 n=1 Tax=Lingula anatina TaxID=7574 RepID=A0A1S3HIK3_LINAN|nr:tectonin beta-propeller repeat-containing protein 2-like isoform X1 [Lingula anatina]|eukprot:XP_013385306.1 tectonin beta-propeller repeat-containing protein 2-like isoform X1 [Lingula anatina]